MGAISMINLDSSNLLSPYNHTELALPDSAGGSAVARTSRRQQRGELKSIVTVAGMSMDPSQFLLEVCDVSCRGVCWMNNHCTFYSLRYASHTFIYLPNNAVILL